MPIFLLFAVLGIGIVAASAKKTSQSNLLTHFCILDGRYLVRFVRADGKEVSWMEIRKDQYDAMKKSPEYFEEVDSSGSKFIVRE